MIAKNMLKYAEALAIQLVLPLRLRQLKQGRPTTRAGRIARAARSAFRKAALAVRVIYPTPKRPAQRKSPERPQWQLHLWLYVNDQPPLFGGLEPF